MLTQAQHYDALIRKFISDAIVERMEHIANRHSISDFSDYCWKVGAIEGLRLALSLCDETKSITDQR
jgi:hypothetical protein